MSDRVEEKLFILGPMADRERFQAEARGKMVFYKGEPDEPWANQPLCFNNFIPVPEHLVTLPRWGESKSFMDATPENSGGKWEQQYWGCKYGPIIMGAPAAPPEGKLLPDLLMYYFETINAVPLEAIRAISAQWPTLSFELFWQAEWETYEPTHLCVFAGGEWIEDRVTTINMYRFRPDATDKDKAIDEGYYTRWTDFRNDVSADWLPEWSEVRAAVERSIRDDMDTK